MSERKNAIRMTIRTDNYTMENLEYYLKGDLKGYANGLIEFSNGKVHEILFRFYDPDNGESNQLVSIDYGYENPMVDEYWGEIEAEITKSVKGVIEAHLKKNKFPITAEQAFSRLKYTSGKRVHSFIIGICLSGADLDFDRVDEIIKAAASVNMLYISNELGAALRHSVAAWDHLYQEWIYLESITEKTEEIAR